jgi:hypothetical protein
VQIVRPAAQPQIGDRRLAAPCVRNHLIELQQAPLAGFDLNRLALNLFTPDMAQDSSHVSGSTSNLPLLGTSLVLAAFASKTPSQQKTKCVYALSFSKRTPSAAYATE